MADITVSIGNFPVKLHDNKDGTYSAEPGMLAKEPFSGSSTVGHTFIQSMNGFSIRNDGASPLTFTIAGDTYTVLENERFRERFSPFTQVTVTAAGAYRAYGLL